TEALALCVRQYGERLVHQHGGRYAKLPGSDRVAHGGARTGASSAYADHEKVHASGQLVEPRLVQWRPGVLLVFALDLPGCARFFHGAFEPRPEVARRLVLVPDESEAPARDGAKPPARRLLLDPGMAQGTDQLDHMPSTRSGNCTALASRGSPAELRLDIATHWPICGATPPPTHTNT